MDTVFKYITNNYAFLEVMKYIPFTYFWHIRTMFSDDVKTILDLGCGKGEFGNLFNKNREYEITGVDIFEPYLEECRENGRYKKVIKGDLRKINFKDKTFDAVVCLQAIEHLVQKDGEELIKKMEKIAKKLIIISTPVGKCDQESYDSNIYQEHLSVWYPRDFIKRGYEVYGIGLKVAYQSYSHAVQKFTLSKIVPYSLSFLMNPLALIYPKIAAQMIIFKRLDHHVLSFNTLPFSYSWIYKHQIGDLRTVLDIGCGEGDFMSVLNRDRTYNVTGIDLYKPYTEKAKKSRVYERVLYGDIKKLKFNDRSFDIVMSSQVIEHLEKKDGLELIKKMEEVAKKKIIIGTPNGFIPFDPYQTWDENPLQVHKSGWDIGEMRGYGYKVYGQGLGFIYKPGGLAYKFPKMGTLFFLFSYLVSPITYIYPRISAYIIAVKDA